MLLQVYMDGDTPRLGNENNVCIHREDGIETRFLISTRLGVYNQ